MTTAIYATIADFEAYVPGWVTTNEPALQATLDVAERDVNSYLKWRTFSPLTTPDFLALNEIYRSGLRDAVCAQAHYRMTMGEEFFVEKPTPTSGPDYSTTKAPPWFGPQARQELIDTGVVSISGTIGRRNSPVQPERRFSNYGW